MPIFIALFAVPLLEIATFIAIGSKIGIAATLALTLLTALAGTILLRQQGLKTINNIRADLAQDRLPARPLADGAMIAVAGILLLTPGFLTDVIGLSLFLPPVRDFIWRQARKRIDFTVVGSGGGPGRARPSDDTVIDLDDRDYSTRPDDDRPGDSPWRDDKR